MADIAVSIGTQHRTRPQQDRRVASVRARQQMPKQRHQAGQVFGTGIVTTEAIDPDASDNTHTVEVLVTGPNIPDS